MSKKFGDRKDAARVPLSALGQCSIDLKPARSVSDVYINRKLDVSELVRYVEAKKEAGVKYTYFHAFLTAIAKVIYHRPKLNYFVANRHLYEHNTISLAFVAKKELSDRSEELMVILKIDPEDTIATIAEKIKQKLERVRGSEVSKKGANSAIDTIAKLPNILRVPLMGIFKWMDGKGILPTGFTHDNLYYSSMIVSNLGSIGCGAIYHNLNDFGTCSSVATMGEILPEKVLRDDGKEEVRALCEFGITLDERIADGFYFSKSCALIAHILAHPECLEEPIENPIPKD